jgi:hypothetical protein
VRRWVASFLLLALFALSVAPTRLPAWVDSLWQSSTLSDPVGHDGDLRAVPGAEQSRVAPSVLRSELGALSRPTALSALVARSSLSADLGLSLAEWLRDERESILRVCWRSAPPEEPGAPALV